LEGKKKKLTRPGIYQSAIVELDDRFGRMHKDYFLTTPLGFPRSFLEKRPQRIENWIARI
jgi:hypothetical protein